MKSIICNMCRSIINNNYEKTREIELTIPTYREGSCTNYPAPIWKGHLCRDCQTKARAFLDGEKS